MSKNFKDIVEEIFEIKDRSYFYRIIGEENTNTYNNNLKEIDLNLSKIEDKHIFFESEIPLSGEMELITYIYNELSNMNINDIVNQDIIIFDNYNINYKFLSSLQYIVNLAVQNENFFNENIRNNFITKIIVWVYTHVKQINFEDNINPKCVYYGEIQRHEVYFLILLKLMDFDVLYINPLKEEHFEEIDLDNISTKINYIQIGQIENFKERCSKGKINNNIETKTKQIQEDIHEELFVNTGIYKPWQYRGGFTKSVLLDTILEDIYIYLHEPVKVREGFEVNKNIVSVPCFFYKIDGQYEDVMQYQKLVNYCMKESEQTVLFNKFNLFKDVDLTDDMYELMFYQLSDGTFDIEEIKKLDIYKFSRYSIETQDFILNKFNEVITRDDIFNKKLDKEDILRFLVLILNLDKNIVRLIDSFDFLHDVPKVVIYLDNEDDISENMLLGLGYLHNIGMDIIIFNPSAMCNITSVIKPSRITTSRLEKINYKSTYKSLMLNKADTINSIISKLFK